MTTDTKKKLGFWAGLWSDIQTGMAMPLPATANSPKARVVDEYALAAQRMQREADANDYALAFGRPGTGPYWSAYGDYLSS